MKRFRPGDLITVKGPASIGTFENGNRGPAVHIIRPGEVAMCLRYSVFKDIKNLEGRTLKSITLLRNGKIGHREAYWLDNWLKGVT